MKIHARSHLGNALAISISALTVVFLACILIPKTGDDLQWLKIAAVAIPGGMCMTAYLRSYRPSNKILQMAFPTSFSFRNPPGSVTLHHKMSEMLRIIAKKILSKDGVNFRAGANIEMRLATETVDLTAEALSRGYSAVCFSSVHLRKDKKFQLFVSQLKERLPNAEVHSIEEPTTLVERTLLCLATGRPYRVMPATHRTITVYLKRET